MANDLAPDSIGHAELLIKLLLRFRLPLPALSHLIEAMSRDGVRDNNEVRKRFEVLLQEALRRLEWNNDHAVNRQRYRRRSERTCRLVGDFSKGPLRLMLFSGDIDSEPILKSVLTVEGGAILAINSRALAIEMQGNGLDLVIAALVRDLKPERFIYVPPPTAMPQLAVAPVTFRHIRQKLGVPVVVILYDAMKPFYQDLAASLGPAVDLIGSLDMKLDPDALGLSKDQVIDLWTPVSFDAYQPEPWPRRHQIGFVGAVDGLHHDYRGKALEAARKAGLTIETGRGGHIPYSEMARIYSGALFVPAFPIAAADSFWDRHPLDRHASRQWVSQVKGRVFEAIAGGAVVLWQTGGAGADLADYLTPGESYLPYSHTRELIDIVSQVGADQSRWESIAATGRRVVESRYSVRQFWETIAAGLEARTGSVKSS